MNDPRLLDLLDRYLEQTLSDTERIELEEKLLDSSDARRMFWQVADQHALMRELAAEEEGLLLARQETSSDTSVVRRVQGLPRSTRVRRRLRSSSSSSPTWKVLFAAAAAVVFISILVIAFRPAAAPVRPERLVRQAPSAPAPIPVAPKPRVKPTASVFPRKADAPEPTPPGKSRAPISPALPLSPPKRTPPKLPPPVPAPKPAPDKPVAPTIVAIAKVASVRGRVSLVKEGARTAPAAGTWITGGERLETGPESRAAVEYLDGTRVEVIGEASSAVFTLRPGGGKDVRLDFGVLKAVVAKQKTDQPLIVSTPTARARVLGTEFTAVVLNGTSRIEVTKGLVRLERASDDAAVDVRPAHYAVASPRGPLRALPLPKTLAVIGFTLINCDTNEPIEGFEPLVDGAVIRTGSLPTRKINIRADTIPLQVGCVSFELDGSHANTERAAPYALATSSVRTYGIWNYQPGAYVLKATPWSGGPAAGKRGGTGTEGISQTIRFRIVEGN